MRKLQTIDQRPAVGNQAFAFIEKDHTFVGDHNNWTLFLHIRTYRHRNVRFGTRGTITGVGRASLGAAGIQTAPPGLGTSPLKRIKTVARKNARKKSINKQDKNVIGRYCTR